MRVNLLFKDKNYKFRKDFTNEEQDVIQDLGLDIIIKNFSNSSNYLKTNITSILLDSLTDIDEINYRQQGIIDSTKNSTLIIELYNFLVEANDVIQKNYHGIIENNPSTILTTSNSLLSAIVKYLRTLTKFANLNYNNFKSESFKRLLFEIKEEITLEYLNELEDIITNLKFENGTLISAKIGPYITSTDFHLHKFEDNFANKLKWKFAPKVIILPQDRNGGAEFNRRMDKGVNKTANIIAQATNHFLNYLSTLREELSYFVCGINLASVIIHKDLPLVYPTLLETSGLEYDNLYDIALSLRKKTEIIGNSHNVGKRNLVLITGANQGGKSTYLRSIGQSFILMQAGFFVPAKSFSASPVVKVITHFNREEDSHMISGKLDEELSRMSQLVNILKPNSLVLLNESFSSTNEREGSEIGRQIATGLVDSNIRVFYVTHMYDLSHGLYETYREKGLFLRASRFDDGTRSFEIIEAEPLKTSYAMDIYNEVFNDLN